jgi:hypothetical protein
MPTPDISATNSFVGRPSGQERPNTSKGSTQTGTGPVTPIVNKIHFCTTCNTDTIWCRDTKDPTKAFCCKCGEVEELAAEALLD